MSLVFPFLAGFFFQFSLETGDSMGQNKCFEATLGEVVLVLFLCSFLLNTYCSGTPPHLSDSLAAGGTPNGPKTLHYTATENKKKVESPALRRRRTIRCAAAWPKTQHDHSNLCTASSPGKRRNAIHHALPLLTCIITRIPPNVLNAAMVPRY